jgi:hypothetical protein
VPTQKCNIEVLASYAKGEWGLEVEGGGVWFVDEDIDCDGGCHSSATRVMVGGRSVVGRSAVG